MRLPDVMTEREEEIMFANHKASPRSDCGTFHWPKQVTRPRKISKGQAGAVLSGTQKTEIQKYGGLIALILNTRTDVRRQDEVTQLK